MLRNRAITSSMAETLIDKGVSGVQKSAYDVTFMYKGRTYRVPRYDWNDVTGPTGKSLARVESDARSWEFKRMSRVDFKFGKKGGGFISETEAVDGSGKMVTTKMIFDQKTGEITLSDGTGNEATYDIDQIADEMNDAFQGDSAETVAQVMGRALGVSTSKAEISAASLSTNLGRFLRAGKRVTGDLVSRGFREKANLSGLDDEVSDALSDGSAEDLGDAFGPLVNDLGV